MVAPNIESSTSPMAVGVKRSMTLDLGGQRLTVLSDSDEGRVRELVDFVNRKLDEARASARRAQPDQIALLALLNVAEELFREKLSGAALRRRVRERSVRLLGAIDDLERAFDTGEPLLSADAFEGTDGTGSHVNDGG